MTEGAPGGLPPTTGVPGGINRGKTTAAKSRLCFLASTTAASLLQRCQWMRVATCTSWMLLWKKSTRPRGTGEY